MSQLTGREPGVVGAALDDPDSWCGIIVDGQHVDPTVLRIALALQAARPIHAGHGCDAKRSARPRRRFQLQGRTISVADGVLRRRRRHAGRLRHRHGERRSATQSRCWVSNCPRPCAWRASIPAEFLGLGRRAWADRAGLQREPGARGRPSSASSETWIDGVGTGSSAADRGQGVHERRHPPARRLVRQPPDAAAEIVGHVLRLAGRRRHDRHRRDGRART